MHNVSIFIQAIEKANINQRRNEISSGSRPLGGYFNVFRIHVGQDAVRPELSGKRPQPKQRKCSFQAAPAYEFHSFGAIKKVS